MILIQDTIVSLEVLEKEFCCDLETCKGCCCVEGDAGPPVTAEEEQVLNALLPDLLPHMTQDAREVVAQQGIAYNDPSGERVLSIVNDKDCIFARTDHNGWCYCVIEKLFRQAKPDDKECHASQERPVLRVPFKKPISCHLYPIRLTQIGERVGVEYHRWDICHSSRQLGHKLHLPLYKFLKEPLIRRFGQAWYDELCLTAYEWQKAKAGNPI
ncbi:MAG: DUF3109 family protein [Paludibacteraceae bacterium]|nr:DUF3109 family protein [Paludibacteraceae bacterium]